MSNHVFITVDEEFLMERLAQCRQRACYAAPGLHLWAAKAFVELNRRLGPERATVITDADPFVIQVGYGTEEALALLAQHNISVRTQPGLRIGVLIADEFAAVFGPPAYNLELFPEKKLPNAIVISAAEADRLIQAIAPKWSADPSGIAEPEIGQQTLTPKELEEIHQDLVEHPPVRPDLERQMRVINSTFQIVKIKFSGANLAQRTVHLDAAELGITDPELKRRIAANFKLFEADANHFTGALKDELEGIKRKFNLKSMGEDIGSLVLAKDRAELEKALTAFGAKVLEAQARFERVITRELDNGKQRLREHLRSTLFPKERDVEYVEFKLDALIHGMRFPAAEEVLSKLELDWHIFHVSEQMINKDEFAKKVKDFYGRPIEELVRIESAVGARKLSAGL